MTVQALGQRVLSRPEFIALIAALMALNALAIDVMLPALPYMGEALGVTNENERQLVVSAYMIGFGAAQLAFGPITDRFGRRAPLFFGIGLYVLCAFLATFAPTFAILLGLRFVQGLGAASTRVIATSVVRDRFSGRDMAEVMSLTFMVFMAIPIIAPGIAGIDGNSLPQAPKWTVNWTAGYEHPVGPGSVYVFTDWYYRSKIDFFLYKSVEFSDDQLLEGGLRIGYKTDRYDIAAFARNITNDESAVSGIDFNNLTAMVNEPRIFGVEAGIKF